MKSFTENCVFWLTAFCEWASQLEVVVHFSAEFLDVFCSTLFGTYNFIENRAFISNLVHLCRDLRRNPLACNCANTWISESFMVELDDAELLHDTLVRHSDQDTHKRNSEPYYNYFLRDFHVDDYCSGGQHHFGSFWKSKNFTEYIQDCGELCKDLMASDLSFISIFMFLFRSETPSELEIIPHGPPGPDGSYVSCLGYGNPISEVNVYGEKYL